MIVLETTRALLKFKDYTTISEIASVSGLSRKHVLSVLNQNGEFVWRERKNGRITKVNPRFALREELWNSGKYYAEDTYGAWSVEGKSLKFAGNEELDEKLGVSVTVGGLGDCYKVRVVLDTPENRKELEDAGLRPWTEAVIDDRLWKEDTTKGEKNK